MLTNASILNSLVGQEVARMTLTRHFAAVGAALLLASVVACGSDSSSGPTAIPVIGVTAQAMNSSSIKVTVTSHAGDNSYTIEHAEGASGSFSAAGSVAAPSVAGPLTFTDTTLKVNTTYRYRVITVVGGASSAPS